MERSVYTCAVYTHRIYSQEILCKLIVVRC